jgi:ornithine carbamoyltransferase
VSAPHGLPLAPPRHFLDLDALDAATLRRVLDAAAAMKRAPARSRPLAGKVLAMVFEKPSTRTRVSFDVAMRQLGGEVIVLDGGALQLGRGETIADTARVLSRYVDAIVLRTSAPANLLELADHAGVPVINGLTDESHPCQVMADILTFEERKGPIKGRVAAWCGDGNNVARSWVQAAARFGFELRLACPPKLRPPAAALQWARDNGGTIVVAASANAAVAGADAVITDTWVSMGDKVGSRPRLLRPYQVNAKLMARAKPDAIFMHCLPAHRGQEVTGAVIDGPQSVVFDEAENRLHAQKGILSWCLGNRA